MFKIEGLKLICDDNKERLLNFNKEISYVYAPNSKGKTLLCDCIDYALGAGDKILMNPAMKGIQAIEMTLSVNESNLFLLRERDNFYFKKDLNSTYIQINKEIYDKKITSALLNGDDSEVVAFNEVFDRAISHRTMSFMNFLDQKGMGNLKYIFTKAPTEKFRWYYKDIINYIFNNSNIKEIVAKTKELKILLKKSQEIDKKECEYKIQRDLLFNELKKLDIHVESIAEARERLMEFKNSYNRPESTQKEKDLKFLLIASQSLAEEIKVQQCYCKQGKLIVSREKGIEKLVNTFSDIIKDNDTLKEYANPIVLLLREVKMKTDTFTSIDINETIHKLTKEKQIIDNQIETLKANLIRLSYEETERSISISEQLLQEIQCYGEIEDAKEIKEKIKKLKTEIDFLKKQFDTSKQTVICQNITNNYMSMRETCSFVSEDMQKGLEIVFDAKQVQLYAQIIEKISLENGEEYENKTQFLPGSMARQTTWQILCYLEVISYTLKNVSGLPLLPLVVFDNISMPYDVNIGKNNYKSIYTFIKEYAHKNGIQVIITSNIKVQEVGENDQIDISDGLNPKYNTNID